MPTPFMCHECDKPTMNKDGLCDDCKNPTMNVKWVSPRDPGDENDTMQLDETMLQSRTAINLIKFITKVIETTKQSETIMKDYNRILFLHKKALLKRSHHYRKGA